MKPKHLYLVTKLISKIEVVTDKSVISVDQFTAMVDFSKNGWAGVCPVFSNKKAADKVSRECPGSKVLPIYMLEKA